MLLVLMSLYNLGITVARVVPKINIKMWWGTQRHISQCTSISTWENHRKSSWIIKVHLGMTSSNVSIRRKITGKLFCWTRYTLHFPQLTRKFSFDTPLKDQIPVIWEELQHQIGLSDSNRCHTITKGQKSALESLEMTRETWIPWKITHATCFLELFLSLRRRRLGFHAMLWY